MTIFRAVIVAAAAATLVGCAASGASATAVGGEAASPPDTYDVRLCDQASEQSAELALTEEMFTLQAAVQALDYLETDVGERVSGILRASQQRQSEETAELARDGWETLALGRGNSLLKVRGYLLRQAALTASEPQREAAVETFCDFVARSARFD